MNRVFMPDAGLLDAMAADLSEHSYCLLPQWLPSTLTQDLYHRITRLDEHNALKQAGIGRENDHQLNPQIRQDETRWLTPAHPIDAAYLGILSDLRLALNQRLFLGLFDYEAHYAHYPPGAFYKRHYDAFKGQSSRILTTVLYLNPDWRADDGGQLVLYHPDQAGILQTVEPAFGTFVIFLSEQFPHEVLTCKQDRYSISGWFRRQDPLQAPLI